MKKLIMLLAIGALGLTLTSCGGVFYDDGYYGGGPDIGVGFIGGNWGGGGWGHGHGHGHGGHHGHGGGGYHHGGGGGHGHH